MKKLTDNQKREDEVVRRMLNTPPQPRTKPGKSQAKKQTKKKPATK